MQVTSQAYCWVCCIYDGEGIFYVCWHSGGFAVYLMERVYYSAGFAVYLTERVYFVCAGHLAGILVGLLYIKGPLKPLMDSFILPASGLCSRSHCSQCLDSMTF